MNSNHNNQNEVPKKEKKVKIIFKKIGKFIKKISKAIKPIVKKTWQIIKKIVIKTAIVTKKGFIKLVELIQKILKRKNGLAILGAGAAAVIATITLIVCLIVTSANDNRSHILKKEKWQSFIVYIEGKEIKMGDKISKLKTYGYNATDDNYNGELEQKFTSGGLSFEFVDKKAENGENTIFFSAFNSSVETKKVSECEINGVEIPQQFYQKYDVILPGGLILNDKLTIEEIVKVWGNATVESESSYSWTTNDYDEIKIYLDSNKKIFSIVYGIY